MILIDDCKRLNIEYNEVHRAKKILTEDEIIRKIGGSDKTDGSCSSLALAYMGNKIGYDIIDFRGGKSREIFARGDNVAIISNALKGIKEYNDTGLLAAINLLKVEDGKEYYFAVAWYAAIVRKNNGILEYLELQSKKEDLGWHNLDNAELIKRFGFTKEILLILQIILLKLLYLKKTMLSQNY